MSLKNVNASPVVTQGAERFDRHWYKGVLTIELTGTSISSTSLMQNRGQESIGDVTSGPRHSVAPETRFSRRKHGFSTEMDCLRVETYKLDTSAPFFATSDRAPWCRHETRSGLSNALNVNPSGCTSPNAISVSVDSDDATSSKGSRKTFDYNAIMSTGQLTGHAQCTSLDERVASLLS